MRRLLIRALFALRFPAAAAALARRGLARVTIGTPMHDVGRLHSALAWAAWLAGDRTESLQHALKALEGDAANKTTLWLIREIEGQYSAQTKFFRILYEGTWTFDHAEPDHGFIRKADVAADSEEEALHLAARLEPEPVRRTLVVMETEVLSEARGQPKGIYWSSGHAFYPLNEEEAEP